MIYYIRNNNIEKSVQSYEKILYNSITPPPSSITTFTFINTNKRIIRGFNSAKDQAMSKKGLEDMGFCHFDLFRYVSK